ncbi:mitogen-activated protein kinase kinase 2-like isoform X2 [Arachis stenosperma]|uniref:mitogen-activated protein kinase kinase 2-like isoform X2 n=1 Tax=Arachis stenosperma TaxID=217475 RepID=UPI0025AC3D83|nr:mitogen-activated protein kinase kinase 2-like isoform X2 [Arachis stenosperma]
MQQGGGSDTEVTWEDEQNINKLGRLNNRFLLVPLLLLRSLRRSSSQPPPNPIMPIDNQLSLANIDTIKVVGKGTGGVVQLAQHKWSNQFFSDLFS